MGYCNGPIFVFDQQRLAILDARSSRCWISDMTYAHLATQEGYLGIIKDFRDEAHAPMCPDGLAIMHRYASCLLSPMLQGIEGVVNGLGYIIARLIEGYSNNAAGIVQL
jgi:hypothetical protein